MKTQLINRTRLFAICVIFGITFAQNTLAKTKAGIVILSKGEFYALDSKNIKRKLIRKSPVYEGDTLSTGADSIGQVRFIDNAIISLRDSTSLRIDEYKKSDGSDLKNENGVLSLIKGGFRTITGAINKNKYKVSTDIASIGVRGTEYEVVLTDGLQVAAWDGSVAVKNKVGNIFLGLGENYNFAKVDSPYSKPVGLLYPPAALTPKFSPALKTASKKKASTIKNEPVSPVAFTNKKSVFNPIDTKVAKAEFYPDDDINNTEIASIPASTKKRDLSTVSLDRLGVLVISGVNDYKFYGGKASNGAFGEPVISDNGYGPHEPGYDTTPAKIALWIDGSVVTSTNVSFGTKQVSYGKWDAAVMQVDPLGTANEKRIQTPVYWITAQATSPLVVSNKTGTATFSTITHFLGSSNYANLSADTSSMTLDFDANTAAGTMNLKSGPSGAIPWQINFSGNIKQNIIDVKVETSSTVNRTNPITGELPMILTGDSGNAAAGSFKLKQVTDSSVHAEGVFIME